MSSIMVAPSAAAGRVITKRLVAPRHATLSQDVSRLLMNCSN